jgi:2-(1,2-epoxy-1,2-dihydrophenyl)acetyl-CoA isomerase
MHNLQRKIEAGFDLRLRQEMQMALENIIYEKKGAVAYVRFNRPKSFNALDFGLIKDFTKAMEMCSDDDTVRAVVITGEGKAFCGGGDIAVFRSFFDKDRAEPFRELIKVLNPGIITLRRMKKPVIAAVNGAAGGAGMSIVAACDLRICAVSVRFRTGYPTIGMVGDAGWTLFVPLLVGFGKAMELMLLDPMFDAKQAYEMGFVNMVVEDEKLATTVAEVAERLASGPTKAYAIIKENLNAAMEGLLEIQLERERMGMYNAAKAEDYVEGVNAFLEKRKAKFTGK